METAGDGTGRNGQSGNHPEESQDAPNTRSNDVSFVDLTAYLATKRYSDPVDSYFAGLINYRDHGFDLISIDLYLSFVGR